jgi:hypothetical protein
MKEDAEEQGQCYISHAQVTYLNTVITKCCVGTNKSREILAVLNAPIHRKNYENSRVQKLILWQQERWTKYMKLGVQTKGS